MNKINYGCELSLEKGNFIEEIRKKMEKMTVIKSYTSGMTPTFVISSLLEGENITGRKEAIKIYLEKCGGLKPSEISDNIKRYLNKHPEAMIPFDAEKRKSFRRQIGEKPKPIRGIIPSKI